MGGYSSEPLRAGGLTNLLNIEVSQPQPNHTGIDARAVLKTGSASPLFSFTINFVFNFQQINFQHLAAET
jgi:hypothetical protein